MAALEMKAADVHERASLGVLRRKATAWRRRQRGQPMTGKASGQSSGRPASSEAAANAVIQYRVR